MDVVALTRLATTEEVEAPQLAADLGIAVYEARQKLAVGLPAVVLMTPSGPRATELLGRLHARKHGALACDGQTVVAAGSMVPVREFRFEARELVLEGGVTVPYAEIVALVRAVHRTTVETKDAVRETKFRPIAAIASGGVILTKTVKREVRTVSEDREQVLYVFRRGGVPCLLRERTAHFAGLEGLVKPTRPENFATTVRLLRERAPLVPFDARLVTVRKTPEPPTDAGAPRSFDPVNGGIDLLAHLLALSLPSVGGPFRE
jgi:hypothetical protein